MDAIEQLAEQFESHRAHLRAVGYRMLGSLTEADDAIQEAWLRLSRSDPSEIENLRGWLTTVVARVCLDMLRSRTSRREESMSLHMPDPIVGRADGYDPEHEALLADAVGLALLVVLDTLSPAERVAFVLHDMFAVPFEEIAPIMGRSSVAVRQLASRGRRRVQGERVVPDVDRARQREVVDAFFAAAHNGDFAALVSVLDPNAVLRSDGGTERAFATGVLQGAETIATQATTYARLQPFMRPALVNGVAGAVVAPHGRIFSVLAFTVVGGKIVAIDALADPARLQGIDLSIFDE